MIWQKKSKRFGLEKPGQKGDKGQVQSQNLDRLGLKQIISLG